MRFHHCVAYLGLIALSSCKTMQGSRSTSKAVISGEERAGASGTRKSFYTGYHSPSSQYLYHICIIPKRAIFEDPKLGKVVDPRFLTPDLYVNTMPDPLSSDGVLVQSDSWTKDINQQFVADFFKTSGNASATVSFMKDASASDIMNKVAGGLDVKMNITGGSVSGGAEVSMNSAASDRATTMTYIVNLKADSLQVIPDTGSNPWAMTPYGEVIRNVVATIKDPQAKIDYVASNCGTHYLAQVDFGAIFVASLKVATQSKADREFISGKLKAKLAYGSGAADLCVNKNDIAFGVNASLNISQFGGNPVSVAQVLSAPIPADSGMIFKDPAGAPAAPGENGKRNTGKCGPANEGALAKELQVGAKTTQPAYRSLINCDATNLNDCINSFEAVVNYATSPGLSQKIANKIRLGSSLSSIDLASEEIGGVKALNDTFVDALDPKSKKGFGVTGYSNIPFTIHDFQQAGFDFGVSRGGFGLNERKTKRGGVMSLAAANAPTAEVKLKDATEDTQINQVISEKAEILRDSLYTNLAGIVDAWAYVRDIGKFVESFGQRQDVRDLAKRLNDRMTRIQLTLVDCRNIPSSCEKKLLDYDEASKTDIPISKVIADAEKILRASLKNATFENYCNMTALAQFRVEGPTRWKTTMSALARNAAGSSAANVERYKFPATEEDVTLACQDPAAPACESKKKEVVDGKTFASEFCRKLATDLISFRKLDLTDDGFAGIESNGAILEPVTFLNNIEELKISASSKGESDDIGSSITQLDNLRALEIRHASIPNHDFVMTLPALVSLKLDDYISTAAIREDAKVKIQDGKEIIRSVHLGPNLNSFELTAEPESGSQGILIDLGVVRGIQESGVMGSKRMTKLSIDYNEKVPYQLVGMESYFGFSKPDEMTCKQETSDLQVLKWVPTELALNLLAAKNDLEKNPCCKQVKERCQLLKTKLKDRWKKVECGGDALECLL